MRKKKLINQNEQLFEQLENARFEIEKLKNELAKRDDFIQKIGGDTSNTAPPQQETPDDVLKTDKTEPEEVSLGEAYDYAASVIGKIVLLATEKSNYLTSSEYAGRDTRELVNLILGRTEVAKSDIMSIVLESSDIDLIKKRCETVYDAAREYFDCVIAQ